MQFLDWFVKEQGEEEKNTEDLVKRWLPAPVRWH